MISMAAAWSVDCPANTASDFAGHEPPNRLTQANPLEPFLSLLGGEGRGEGERLTVLLRASRRVVSKTPLIIPAAKNK